MNKKFKFGIYAVIPLLAFLMILVLYFLIGISVEFYSVTLIFIIIIPYSIAFFLEYSLDVDKKTKVLSESELNRMERT